MGTLTINTIIDGFNHLSLEDEEYLLEIAKKQLIEKKRQRILLRARESTKNLRKGLCKKGTVQDLYKDLESD